MHCLLFCSFYLYYNISYLIFCNFQWQLEGRLNSVSTMLEDFLVEKHGRCSAEGGTPHFAYIRGRKRKFVWHLLSPFRPIHTLPPFLCLDKKAWCLSSSKKKKILEDERCKWLQKLCSSGSPWIQTAPCFFFLRLLFVFALDLVFPVTFACWLLGFAWLLLSFRLALNPNFFSSYSPPQSVLREDSSLRQTQVARADLARLTRLLLVPGRPSVVVMMDTTGLLMIPMTCLAQVSRFIIVANPKSQIAALWGMSC